jgi:hypothetical protein
MNYPQCLERLPSLFPLIGDLSASDPFTLDLSETSSILHRFDIQDQRSVQQYIEQQFQEGYTWGIGNYLEYREPLLKDIPQMRSTERYHHLGVDIIAPLGTPLYAPLEGDVVSSTFEEGKGNYGGIAMLRHTGEFETFYSLYGHLDIDSLPIKGDVIQHGDTFAHMGGFHCNGDWFYHTHLQILTEAGLKQGWASRGYCTTEQLSTIDDYCPSPMFLFRTQLQTVQP